MLKDGQKVILFSVIGGAATWLVDALIDSFIFGKGPFWSALTTSDGHELYMRSLFLVSFTLFGFLVSLFLERRRRLEEAKLAAEQALHENEHRLQSVMESIADSIYLVDAEYRYLFMNRIHVERLGLTGVDYRGKAYGSLHTFEETEDLIEQVDQVFATGRTVRSEHLSRRDNKYFLRTFSPVRDSKGSVVAVTVVSKDVNDLKQLEEKLRTLSLADELTGLYNRRGFFTMAEPLLKLTRRHGTPAFLLYADLDNLKEINDVLGHHEGDRALIDTAHILQETFRGTDIIARMGGDEFVVVTVAGKKQDAEIIVSRFREQLAAQNQRSSRPYTLSISIGVACCDGERKCVVDDLLKEAEQLMYGEKMQKRRPA